VAVRDVEEIVSSIGSNLIQDEITDTLKLEPISRLELFDTSLSNCTGLNKVSKP
jgi:hypothetical protein